MLETKWLLIIGVLAVIGAGLLTYFTSKESVVLPEVNNENCVMGVLESLPDEARLEFKQACREFKDRQFLKHNFKRGKARDYLK